MFHRKRDCELNMCSAIAEFLARGCCPHIIILSRVFDLLVMTN